MTGTAIVRSARSADLQLLCALDPIARADSWRRDRIARGIESGEVRVAETDDRVVGYALMSCSFFGRPFIELVMIDPAHRGAGLGPQLIRSLEASRPNERLFTSTNESNGHMRHVLEKLGYEPSGIVHHLDPGDPEIIYSKAPGGSA